MKNKKDSKKSKSWKVNKKIIIPSVIIVVLAVVGIISRVAYDNYFMRTGGLPLSEKMNYEPGNAVFEGLERTRYEFFSNNHQKLVGYNYRKTDSPKALIIFVHGFGGDHNFYKPLINSLTSRGYWVFAFDATGTGESEGDSMIGLEQHTIDLEYALKFVQSEETFNNLEISLIGHSWGGYAVSAILNLKPKVSSVISISGFSSAYDLELNELQEMIGGIGNLALPYLKLTELTKFGKYESFTGLSGFQKSITPGLIIASEDDNVVAPDFGYELYKKNLPESRLEYVVLDKRGHAPYWTDEAVEKFSEFMTCMNDSCKDETEQKIWDEKISDIYRKHSLDDEYDVSKHPEAWAEIVDFLNSRFSPEIWQNSVDEGIIDKIDDFITRNSNA